jgi:hypothetical protein
MAALIAEFRSREGIRTPISRDPLLVSPLLVQLETFGAGGELLVVDEETGRIVVRCPLGRAPEEGDREQPHPAALAGARAN